MTKRRADRPLVELTEGAIRVSWRGKTRTIVSSAAPPNAEEAPDFTVSLDDVTFWDPPDDSVEIEMPALQAILEAIDEAFDRLGLSIEYE
jgi:hypothetical protein